MYLEEIFSKTLHKKILLSAKIALTPHCNLSCKHCYVSPQHNNILTIGEWVNIIDQLAKFGCLFLTLTGGEPTIYPDFQKIIAHVRERKFFLRLYTNGVLIDEATAFMLAEKGVNEVYISLYGSKAEVHDLVTGTPGSFAQTCRAIQNLKKYGVKVFIKTSIMSINQDYADQLEEFCRGLDVEYNQSFLIMPRTDGSIEPCALQYTNDDILDAFAPNSQNTATNLKAKTINACPAAENSCYIEYDGTLYPCVNYRYPIGNVLYEKLPILWASKAIKEIRAGKAQQEQCGKCPALDKCLRCPGLSYYESGSTHGYSHLQCRHTALLRYLEERRLMKDGQALC